MGQCTLLITSTGLHHNNDPVDFDQMAKDFVAEIKATGVHTIHTATLKADGMSGEQNLLIVESGDATGETEYGAFIDGILKGLMLQFRISGAKFLKHPKFKEAIHCLIIVAKDCTDAPANIDDILYDQVETLINKIIDQQQLAGPVEVGAAAPPRLKRIRTKAEVVEEIKRQGGDPTRFNPMILSLLMYLPNIIEFIRTLLGK